MKTRLTRGVVHERYEGKSRSQISVQSWHSGWHDIASQRIASDFISYSKIQCGRMVNLPEDDLQANLLDTRAPAAEEAGPDIV